MPGGGSALLYCRGLGSFGGGLPTVKGSFFFLSLEPLATGTTCMEANQYPA